MWQQQNKENPGSKDLTEHKTQRTKPRTTKKKNLMKN